MRVPRIKEEGEGFYHLLSRIVDRRRVLDEKEKERFRQLMHRAAVFSGIDVLTYSILDNIDRNAVRASTIGPAGRIFDSGAGFLVWFSQKSGTSRGAADVLSGSSGKHILIGFRTVFRGICPSRPKSDCSSITMRVVSN